MELSLYLSATGVHVAVPDCLRPSVEAEHLHGPLRFLRRLALDEEHVSRVAPRLTERMDQACYAVLSAEEARGLLASASHVSRTPEAGAGDARHGRHQARESR